MKLDYDGGWKHLHDMRFYLGLLVVIEIARLVVDVLLATAEVGR